MLLQRHGFGAVIHIVVVIVGITDSEVGRGLRLITADRGGKDICCLFHSVSL